MERDIEEIRQELTEVFYENFGIFEQMFRSVSSVINQSKDYNFGYRNSPSQGRPSFLNHTSLKKSNDRVSTDYDMIDKSPGSILMVPNLVNPSFLTSNDSG